VLSGGELPVMVIIDAIARLLPEVLGNQESSLKESFQDGLLEGAQFTRPRQIDGSCLQVPPVLLGGDHEAKRLWELRAALIRTYERRPELLVARNLNSEERKLLAEYFEERSS
jgi:tRNA (guanine37-N1)-methyltransferase